MRRHLAKRPWLLVVAAFVALVGAWIWLVMFANANADEPVPVSPADVQP